VNDTLNVPVQIPTVTNLRSPTRLQGDDVLAGVEAKALRVAYGQP